MTTVVLHELPTGRTKQLEPWQVDEFLAELLRVKIYWWITFTRGRIPMTASPEVTIEVNRNGTVSTYELYGGQILYETKTRKRFQFYMGYLLLSWLLK